MPIFPGDPKVVITPLASESGPWRVTALRLGTHSGTHIDAPSHYIADGASIDHIPLERFVCPGRVVRVLGLAPDAPISAEHLAPHLERFPAGGALILHTGWDTWWEDERYFQHPYLTSECARLLVRTGVGIVGIDALNVDSTVQGTAAVHEILLGAGVLIVENLTGLDQLAPERRYTFLFVPLRLEGLDGSPIRAFAWEEFT